jgi:cell division transport system permease protein
MQLEAPWRGKRRDQVSLLERGARRAIAWTRGDLALAYGATRVHLPVLVAVLVFLCGLALAGALVLSDTARRWSSGLSGTITVELPAVVPHDPSRAAERLYRALAVLSETPGIARAEPLGAARLGALLAPWLGGADLPDDLPLPQLIDVTVASGATVDVAALSAALAAVVPGASADDHRRWLVGFTRLARLVVIVAIGLVAVVALATAGAVAFATRAGLAVHQQAIELLHLIGASDGYIARQFARRALVMGMVGGAIGFFAAAATAWGIARAMQAIDPALPPAELAALLPLAGLVPAAGAVAMASAHWTVRRALARMA